MALHLLWRAVVIYEVVFEIGVVSGVVTGTKAQTGEGAVADLKAAGVLG